MFAIVSLPDTAFAPAHAPLATQVVASVLLHVSVDEPFTATEVGFAESERVGGAASGFTDTVTLC
jgi:hypothetical protein